MFDTSVREWLDFCMKEQKNRGLGEYIRKEQAFTITVDNSEVECIGLGLGEVINPQKFDSLCESLTSLERGGVGAENGIQRERFDFFVSDGVIYIMPSRGHSEAEWRGLKQEGVSTSGLQVWGEVILGARIVGGDRLREVTAKQINDEAGMWALMSSFSGIDFQIV